MTALTQLGLEIYRTPVLKVEIVLAEICACKISTLKALMSPTRLKLLKVMKIYDIIKIPAD